jgi:hypothetical protein
VTLGLQAVARGSEQALGFVKALADRPEFDQVFLQDLREEEGGLSCRYAMTYLPEAGPPPSPAAPAPGAAAEGEADP